MGLSRASVGPSWALLGGFLGVQNRAFVKHLSKMGPKRPFGSILDRFGEVLEGFWKDLGRIRGGFGLDLG